MSTAVRVNTHAYAATHVATGLINSLRKIVKSSGLDPARLTGQWTVLEAGIAAWLESQHLRALVMEIYDPRLGYGDDLVGRFDFTIDYGYYPNGDGDLWLDPETVYYTVRKAGSFPSQCDYRFIATTSAGRPDVPGWSTTNLRSTNGFARNDVGTSIGGGSLGAGLSYYTRTAS
ncbi:hypothetical protein [Streptomyces sp. MMS20-AI2-20]|uniref:hypothetical protein n=1 Tax=Streptomyces sp. MMS20-AI2-20 TaxID=2925835 RepID=UPI001F613019|nr:hypothetical protein [Streptomyces sp. MMS20-AI2-20]MCI4142227.1 hypothetical protein [Streptomyces sp. MMS20-AI2-20]